jgi:hypothetical protein
MLIINFGRKNSGDRQRFGESTRRRGAGTPENAIR